MLHVNNFLSNVNSMRRQLVEHSKWSKMTIPIFFETSKIRQRQQFLSRDIL